MAIVGWWLWPIPSLVAGKIIGLSLVLYCVVASVQTRVPTVIFFFQHVIFPPNFKLESKVILFFLPLDFSFLPNFKLVAKS